jgi:hypothetical protein
VPRCLELFHPKKLKGFGKTDGEATERLWSDLGPYSRTTKEMLSGNRQDLLEDALLHTWKRVSKGLLYKLENDLLRRIKEVPSISLSMTRTSLSYQEYERLKKIERDILLTPRPTSPLIQWETSIQCLVCAIRTVRKDLTFSNAQTTGTLHVYDVNDTLDKMEAKLELVSICFYNINIKILKDEL